MIFTLPKLEEGGYVDTGLLCPPAAVLRTCSSSGQTDNYRANVTEMVKKMMRDALSSMTDQECLHPRAGVGGFVSRPYGSKMEIYESARDNLYGLIWVTWGWGPMDKQQRCMANAFRMGLATAMTGWDTLAIVSKGCKLAYEVESQDSEGRFPMGIYLQGGAKIVESSQGYFLTVSDGMAPRQNDSMATMAAGLLGTVLCGLNPGGFSLPAYVEQALVTRPREH